MKKPIKLSEIYSMNPMPNTSPLTASFNLLLILLFHVHQINFFYSFLGVLYPNMESFFTPYTLNLLLTKDVVPVCYAFFVVLILLILLVVLYNQEKFEGFRYILAWLGSRMFPILRILIELNVAITAYFMMVDLYSGIMFGVAVIINLLVTFFMQNYSIKKDYLCCRDVDYLILFKSLIYVAYAMDALAVAYPSSVMMLCALIAHVGIALTMYILYFVRGITIYEHSISRTILIGLIVVYLSLVTGQLCDELCRFFQYYNTQLDMLYAGVFCLQIGVLSYCLFCHIREHSLGDKQKSLKNKVYFVGDKVGSFSASIQDECQMRGLIKYHIDSNCTNPNCFTGCDETYDSKNNKSCSLAKISQNKQLFLKLYVKCLYEKNLEKDTSVSSKIDYTEFYYYMLRNTYKALHLVCECDGRFQFPYDRIRITRLKKAILLENRRLNQQLYEGNLDIQVITDCQKRFEELKLQVSEVLKRNLQYWQHVHRNKIDLTQLIQIIKPNFATMETINNNWKELAKYFEIQKKWKFYYAWYILYVKNEKLKPVILEYFGTEVHEEELFSIDPRDFDQSNEKSELKNSKIIFECNTAVLHTNDDASHPEIKQANNYFTRLFGYSEAEVAGVSIDILMPRSIVKVHTALFEDWVMTGRSNSEPNYPIRRIFARHKSGYLFCVYKYLKQLVGVNGSLQYVVMMKTSKEDETMLLMDESCCVQGMSRSLYHKLGFEKVAMEQIGFPLLNFLLICPKFIRHSQFKSLLNTQDENFFGIQHEKRKEKTTTSLLNVEHEKTREVIRELQVSNAQLNMENMKSKVEKQKPQNETEHYKLSLRIPENIIELLNVYEVESQAGGDVDQCYKTLKKAFLFSRNCKNFLRFNCEADIVTRRFNSVLYYEVYLREMYSLDNRSEESVVCEKRRKKPITFVPEDFHKFFESSQDNRAYSLAFSNNIFIKEDNNRPVQSLSHIGGLIFFMRLLFFTFVVIVLVAFLFNSFVNFQDFQRNSNRLLKMSLFDLQMPYLQSELYDVAFTNNGVLDSSLASSIYAQGISLIAFNHIEDLKVSGDLMKSIFDPLINVKEVYTSNGLNTVTYDEIDIIYKSFQAIESIMTSNLDNYSLSTDGAVFLQQYLTPSLSQLITQCSQRIQDTFSNSLSQIDKIIIIMYVIQGLAIGLGLLLAIHNTRKIMGSFIAIMDVFTQFSQPDVVKIYKYCHCLAKIFRHLNDRDIQQRWPQKTLLTKHNTEEEKLGVSHLSFNGNYYESDNSNNININKKIKKVELGSLLNKLRLKTYAFFIVFLIFFAASSFYLNIFIKSNANVINDLATEGSTVFQSFALLNKAQLAVKKRFANSTQYDEQYAQYFQQDISQLMQMRNISAIAKSGNFRFQQVYNNMYFSDVCILYSQLLLTDLELQWCRLVGQNCLQHGIQSYIYYFISIAGDFLSNTNGATLTGIDLDNLDSGLYFVNLFLESLASRWQQEFQEIVAGARQNLLIYSVCILAGYLLVYLVLIEVLVIGTLNNNYEFFKRVYEMYMPDYLVSKEKIIKAKLIVDGILNK